MARLVNDSRYPAYLPKNWRVVTAAGVVTFGMACGLVQPALGEWWKGAQPEKSATTAKGGARKIAPAENGFEATIRRLMTDSRRAFDQGDHAKAIKLAERAAKISEAAVQVLGPMSECSPEETERFLVEMRTRCADPVAGPAAQPQQPSPNQPVKVSAGSSVTAPKVPGPAVPPPIAPSRTVATKPSPTERMPAASHAPAQRQVPPVVVQSPPPKVLAPGWSVVGPNPAQSNKSVVKAGSPSLAATSENSLPPSPTLPPTTTTDLLAQSRRAAANNQLEQAIELAEQSVQTAAIPSLFGPATKSSSAAEATRWRDYLVSQRNSMPERSDEVFEPPVNVVAAQQRTAANPPAELATSRTLATPSIRDVEDFPEPAPVKSPTPSSARLEAQALLAKARQVLPEGHLDEARQLAIEAERLKVPYDLFDDRPDLVLADVARAAKRGPTSAGTPVASVSIPQSNDEPAIPDVPATDEALTANVNTAHVRDSAPAPTTSEEVSGESLWSEELPPASRAESKETRPPLKFARSAISRAWAEMEAVETSPNSADSRASVEANLPAADSDPQEPNEALPEFPIDNSTTQSGGSGTQVATSVPAAPPATDARNDSEPEVTNPVVPESAPVRGPLRLRGRNSVAAVEASESTLPLTASAENADPVVSDPLPVRPSIRLRNREQHAVAAAEFTDLAGPSTAGADIPETAVAESVAPLRLLGSIQQVTAETSATTSQAIELVADSGDRPDAPQSAATSNPIPARWADSSNASPALDVPVQRFPVQRVLQLRRRLESAAALNPGGWPTNASQSSSTGVTAEMPAAEPVKSATPTSAASQESEVPHEQWPTTGKRPPVKLRERSRLQLAASTNASSQVTGAAQPWMPAVGRSNVTPWRSVDATPGAPPISQAGFESSDPSSGGLNKAAFADRLDSVRLPDNTSGASEADVAPPPPTEPWFDDETRKERKASSEVVHKSSFAMIDRLAEAFKLTVSTMISLIGGGGLALVLGGLIAIRTALRRRHSA